MNRALRSPSPLVAASLALALGAAPLARSARADECDPTKEDCGPDAPRVSGPRTPAPAPANEQPMDPYPSGATRPAGNGAPNGYPPAPSNGYPNNGYPPSSYPGGYGYPPGYTPPPGAYAPGYRGYPAPYGGPMPTAHVEEQRRWSLFSGGLSIFGGLYATTAGTAAQYATSSFPTGWLYVPVIGPVAYIPAYSSRFNCNHADNYHYCPAETDLDRAMYTVLVIDAVLQAGGLTMAALGIFTKKKVTVWSMPAGVSLAPAPLAGGAGVAATGRF